MSDAQTAATLNINVDTLYTIQAGFLALQQLIGKQNARWWRDPATGAPIERNFGELMMLATSELSEALEGDRKGLNDDKLPHRSMREVEIADALIRLYDTGHGLRMDLVGALIEKLVYNASRVDHTDAARLAPGGKRY